MNLENKIKVFLLTLLRDHKFFSLAGKEIDIKIRIQFKFYVQCKRLLFKFKKHNEE